MPDDVDAQARIRGRSLLANMTCAVLLVGGGAVWYGTHAMPRNTTTPRSVGRDVGVHAETHMGNVARPVTVRWDEGWNRTMHPNGQIKDERFVVDGLTEGKIREWYASGQIRNEVEYRAGHPDGEYRAWSEDGTLFRQGQYRAGEMVGEWRCFSADPTVRERLSGTYVDGRRVK